jgi:hypothetical protein
MKLFSVITLALVICATAVFARSPRYNDARKSLEKAHSLVEQRNAGMKGANVEEILKAVINAETHLNDAKNNRGSALPVALKAVGDAKTELLAAQSGKEGQDAHVQKADQHIQDALKHVMQALHEHPGKS